MNLPQRNKKRARRLRRAIATVELAVCLPLLVLIVFGSIQAADLIYLKHAVTSAAYEGLMEVSKPNATNASVTARAQQVLDARSVSSSTIQIKPNGTQVDQLTAGDDVRVVVTANVTANLPLTGFFTAPTNVKANLAGTR